MGVPDAQAGEVEGRCGDGGAGNGAAEVGLLGPATRGAWISSDGMWARGWGWGIRTIIAVFLDGDRKSVV